MGADATTALLLAIGLAAAAAPTRAALPAPRDVPYAGTLRLQVDATDLDHRVFRVREQIPVRPGSITLLYPHFLPGTHEPTGQVERLAGLAITEGGVPLAWRRDTIDPFAFTVNVPDGGTELSVEFQFLSPLGKSNGRVMVTRELLDLQWNTVVLYPAGHGASDIEVQASLTLPAGWQSASALPVASRSGAAVRYGKVSLETLVDSPVYAGAHYRRVELDPPGTPNPVVLDLFGDDDAQIAASDEQLRAHRNLVAQADRLFGARHFAHYDFLLAVSDRLGRIGLEHHQSSENVTRPDYFKDWAKHGGRDLLPHEYVHSWNGKFRRPRDLWTPSFEVPMQDSLLWVYEGQTQFWGRVLAARSGLVSIAQTHDEIARAAAAISARTGRAWRTLQDTTNEATFGVRGRDKDWFDWQRGADYDDESMLIWLDVDTLIREASGGTRSLDDFARAFFGTAPGRVAPLLYDFDDVVAALNAVQPHDWRTFLRERLDARRTGALLDGLTRSGWQLGWSEAPSPFARPRERSGDDERAEDFAFSLGADVKRDGTIDAVRWQGAAFRAGLNRGEQILAVNGAGYRGERLAAAITAAKGSTTPIELIVKDGDRFRLVRVDYRGGLRYPHLERIANRADVLDVILAPRN
ncbi:MAG: peptidase M61 [Caldimonas sp.]